MAYLLIAKVYIICYNTASMKKNNQNINTEIALDRPQKLWTKDFSIIIFGSFISLLGAAVVGFAFGLLVFDKTGSTLKYAIMMAGFVVPQLIVPIFAGAFFDRHSRRKAIYILDYIFSLMFVAITLVTYYDYFNYYLYLAVVVLFGSLNSVYMVAYDSFYPNLISKGNYSKAYAISSLLYPIASTIMVPVAGWAYDVIGVMPLFAFSACCSFVTATVETLVTAKEPHLEQILAEPKEKRNVLRQFNVDLKDGLTYIKNEKGLLVITAYFFVTMSAGAVLSTLFLPFLKTNFSEVTVNIGAKQFVWGAAFLYSIIMGANTVGRLLGGAIHYKFRFPANKKFDIALTVYVIIGVLDAIILFMPKWWIMVIVQIIAGVFAVTSFNIRISGTQNHVQDNIRARFNGTFSLITMGGSILGQLVAGLLGEYFDARYIVLVAMIINFIAIWTIMFPGRNHVKPIYNNQI